jgi:hypothetical protein
VPVPNGKTVWMLPPRRYEGEGSPTARRGSSKRAAGRNFRYESECDMEDLAKSPPMGQTATRTVAV